MKGYGENKAEREDGGPNEDGDRENSMSTGQNIGLVSNERRAEMPVSSGSGAMSIPYSRQNLTAISDLADFDGSSNDFDEKRK